MHATQIPSMRHLIMLLRQGQSRVSQVEQPEGNGTGFIWDQEGHIITNYHVIGSALQQISKRPGSSTPKVARVTLLGKHISAGRHVCKRHVCELSSVLSSRFICHKDGDTIMQTCCRPAGTDGVSQTFDGYLVGADRSKDLAVLRVNAPKVIHPNSRLAHQLLQGARSLHISLPFV